MTAPFFGLSAPEMNALLAEVTRGAVAPRTAMALMTLHGESPQAAARRVFLALGGSEATELDAQGRPRYVGSGKLVADVERAVAEEQISFSKGTG